MKSDDAYRDMIERIWSRQGEPALNDDERWLVERFTELHSLPPSSRKRGYISGRIDEYCAQNAVTPANQMAARALALADLQAGIREVL